MGRKHHFAKLVVLTSVVGACPAVAQRTDDNAVVAAEDAFGFNVGGESLGLYEPGDVRGFSPIDAGNVRLEGLYMDRQAEFTSRLIAGNTIKVGLAAQTFPFPAPTGIVDYRLHQAGSSPTASAAAQMDSFGGGFADMDLSTPLVEDFLTISGGVGLYRNEDAYNADETVASAAMSGRWTPLRTVTITPFWSRIDKRGQEARPVILLRRHQPIPDIPRRRFFGQSWTRSRETHHNFGTLVAAKLGRWELNGGIFRSVLERPRSFVDLYVDATGSGMARHSIVANPEHDLASTSGTIQLARQFESQRLVASIQARSQTRRYGGSDEVDLGWTEIGVPEPIAPPDFEFSPTINDDVDQTTIALSYAATWRNRVRVSLSVQRSGYEKRVQVPGEPEIESSSHPWLYNGAVSFIASPSLTIFGGYARGLEEGPVAPNAASNRDEAAPALITEQSEVGLRYEINDRLTLNAGAFRITKPYYDLSRNRRFTQIGEVRHQGLEVSLAGKPASGLTFVAGIMLMEPEISAPLTDVRHDEPLGTADRKVTVNVDYRPPSMRRLSFDVSATHIGSLPISSRGTHVPARTIVDIGVRYRFRIHRRDSVLRLEVTNATNEHALNASASGSLTLADPRRLSLRLTTDF